MNRHERRAAKAQGRNGRGGERKRVERTIGADVESSADRHHIIEHNGAAIDLAYQRAKAGGMRDPVVYVVDVRDLHGRGMAMAAGSTETELDAMIADFAARQSLPTMLMALGGGVCHLPAGPAPRYRVCHPWPRPADTAAPASLLGAHRWPVSRRRPTFTPGSPRRTALPCNTMPRPGASPRPTCSDGGSPQAAPCRASRRCRSSGTRHSLAMPKTAPATRVGGPAAQEEVTSRATPACPARAGPPPACRRSGASHPPASTRR
jgi:hypothetical protein